MAKQTIKKHTTRKTFTLEDAHAAFISEKLLQGRSSKTLKNYITSYQIFCQVNGFDSKTPASIIQRHHVYNWIGDMMIEKKPASTINHYIRDIRAFIYYMQENDLCEKFKIEQVSAQETVPKFYTDEEIQILLEKPTNMDNFVEVRTWVIINLVCGTGVRARSVRELKIGEIDLKNGFIVFSATKNKKTLRLPISRLLRPILIQYLEEWRNDAEDDDFVFPDVTNHRLSENGLRLSYERYCHSRGIERTSIHSLRHSFARNWILEGGQPYQLMTALGHSDLTMTKKYVRLFGDDLAETYEQFNLLDTQDKGNRTKQIKRNKRK